MIKTSEAFQAAIVGSPRRIEILAVVDISDPDKTYGTATHSALAPWSQPEELHDKVMDAPSRYATLEPGRWRLDGTFQVFQDDYQVADGIGIASEALSGDDGSFSPAFWIQENISNLSILQACSVFFSADPVDGVPDTFSVEVLSGGTAYYTKTVTGNTATEISLTGFTVHNPDAIRVTVSKWSLPGRRARIVEIIPGIYERWPNRILASFNAKHQGDISGLSLPYGSVTLRMDNKSRRFEPRSKTGVFDSIEERQGVEIYIGVVTASGGVERCCLGVYYQCGTGWQTGDNALTMEWYLVDIIGLLCDRTFLAPATLPTDLKGWIGALAAQLGPNFADRWHVDPDYADLPVSVRQASDVADKKCGDILRWVCQATGTWPRADAETGYLTAEPLWSQGNRLTLSNLVGYPTMSANVSIAALIFTLNDGSSTKYVVSGNTTSSEKTVSINNPFIKTQAAALTAARLILSCYGGNQIETTGRGDPSSEIGDVDTVYLDESSATTARRISQTFVISDGVMQGCRSKLLQADGSYLYQTREVLTASGSWTAPDGVTSLRLILVGGGSGGTDGTDGTWDDNGVDGSPGLGGLIWSGTVSINAGQTFAVTIGTGGAKGQAGTATTLGSYTSAEGKRYSPSYTDVASGDAYGRAGVGAPLAGSGDGGKAGTGGKKGNKRTVEVRDYTCNGTLPNNTSGVYIRKEATVVDNYPTDGTPGVAGASGCVVIYYDK